MSLAFYILLYPLKNYEAYVATNVVRCHKHNLNTQVQDTVQEISSISQQIPLSNLNTEISELSDDNISLPDMPVQLQIKQLKDLNKNRVVIGHLNINSVRNKFEEFMNLISGNIDIILISETKLDSSFPGIQFTMEGYSQPYRRDKNDKSGGLLLFVKEGIISKPLKTKFDGEGMFIEINLRKRKWLLFCGYNPYKAVIKDFLNELSTNLDPLIGQYDNLIIMGDFNSECNESNMSIFCETYDFQNLIKEPTCFKNPLSPSSIDVILTNRKTCFQNSSTLDTSLSDFHKMTITVMKMQYKKLEPKIISYRNYKKFDNAKFRQEIEYNSQLLCGQAKLGYVNIENIIISSLNRLAPIKFKYLRGNHQPFMNKELSKAIMTRSRLKNIYLKHPMECNRKRYTRQRNYCVNLRRRVKRDYYNNLNINNIIDNKKFWKTIKPCFAENIHSNETITLVDKGEIITNNGKVANVLNHFFSNIVDILEIPENNEIINESDHIEDKVEKAIVKYNIHPSIVKIKNSRIDENNFCIRHTKINDVAEIIQSIEVNKATPKEGIPPKVIANNCDILAPILCNDINSGIDDNKFPDTLKYADINPSYKQDDRHNKGNYRPVSLLPVISKVYEKVLYGQINEYFEPILSPIQCGFRKGHGVQNCLLVLLDKWRRALDNKQSAGLLTTDLSKAFDCIRHDLLIAKLHAYGVSIKSLRYIYDYLSDRRQRVRVNNSYSEWENIKYGVPQGSILGPLLFNIFLRDLFMFTDEYDIVNYADDNTPYVCEGNVNNIIFTLENVASKLFLWIKQNYLKANPDKSHLLLSDKEDRIIKIQSDIIQNTNSIKLLGINFDSDLKFNTHVTNICKKASQKVHALARISGFMSQNKLIIVMKAFILSQFNYCPLVWMFYSKEVNNRINHIHERALRIAYRDTGSTFKELLVRDGSVTIHHRNLQILVTEIFKFLKGISPKIMEDVFKVSERIYNLRSDVSFTTNNISTMNYGQQSISYLAPRIWNLVPKDIKESANVAIFKSKIKRWVPNKCPCRLCQRYIPNLGFI